MLKYRDIVNNICNDGWENNEADKYGGYGVACLLAYMNGASPEAASIANHLNVETESIKIPFSRLAKAGVFARGFDARNDKALLGQLGDAESRCAWCHVAGIASDAIYRHFSSFNF